METFFITCNGDLINYKGKKACNAQLLFHYILITLHLFLQHQFPDTSATFTNKEANGHLKNTLKLYCILEV